MRLRVHKRSTRGGDISYHLSIRREPYVVELAPGHLEIREGPFRDWVTATGINVSKVQTLAPVCPGGACSVIFELELELELRA
jgi:hypothetical protein